MKNLYILMLMVCFAAIAQEEGRFRFGINAGYAKSADADGYSFNIEPKYNIEDNMNVGLRLGYTGLKQDVSFSDGIIEYNDEVAIEMISVGATYDYYFDELTGGAFTPYAGAGLTMNAISSDYGENENKFGALLRGGFEWGKFRVSAEYNFMSSEEYDDGENTIEYKYGYFMIGVGIFIGGGTW